MMFQDQDPQSAAGPFSQAMQRRMDKMLQNADRLFSLGWLRKRLWATLSRHIADTPATEFGDYGRVLQGGYESRFLWGYLSACQKAVTDIRRTLDSAYEGSDPLQELLEDREELIREFARMSLSRTWECVKDDDQSWRNFARRMPLNDPARRDEIDRFFEIIDRISVITDIVCHRAHEYGVKVDYTALQDYDRQQQRMALTDEVLARAIEAVSYHLSSYSAWTVVFCVLRDDYGCQNQSQFERDVVQLPFKSPMKGCPEGTVSKTMSNNDFLYYPTSKWPPDSKFRKFANDLRGAIKAELSQ